MTGSTRDPAALLRGVAAAGLTAALALAAHTAAGGAPAAGAVAVVLAVVAATVGALAATMHRADRGRVLLVLLGAGQLAGHVVLGAAGHAHAGGAVPAPALMAGTHLAAVAVGAALIAAGGRLCSALSRTVRIAVRVTGAPPAPAVVLRLVHDAHRSLQPALMLAGPVTHRGPPVAVAR